MSVELVPDEFQRLIRRKGFHDGILFVLDEVAHGAMPQNLESVERTRQRLEWVLERLTGGDEPFSLEDLDREFPRLDGTRINDPLPHQDKHVGAPPAEPGSGCRAGGPASRP